MMAGIYSFVGTVELKRLGLKEIGINLEGPAPDHWTALTQQDGFYVSDRQIVIPGDYAVVVAVAEDDDFATSYSEKMAFNVDNSPFKPTRRITVTVAKK